MITRRCYAVDDIRISYVNLKGEVDTGQCAASVPPVQGNPHVFFLWYNVYIGSFPVIATRGE